jgi:hypothetical protein
MKVCISGPNKGLEVVEFYKKVADKIESSGFETVNKEEDGKMRFNKLEDVVDADVLVARMASVGSFDTMWTQIGVARAGDIPIVPLWNEGYEFKGGYGFTKDIINRNRPLIRKEGDQRPWPSVTKDGALDYDGLIEEILEIWKIIGDIIG